jgi:uncharacterized protein (DUF39 family)
MNYKVKVSHIFSEVFDVEAENENDAKEKVIQELNREDREVKGAVYEITIPSENWPVISEEKYQELLEKFNKEQNSESEIAK